MVSRKDFPSKAFHEERKMAEGEVLRRYSVEGMDFTIKDGDSTGYPSVVEMRNFQLWKFVLFFLDLGSFH